MGVIFPREHITAELPVYQTKEEWEKNPPTKLNTLLAVVRHLLSSDEAPMPSTEDGILVCPPIPANAPRNSTRKILIYNEFAFFAPLIVQLFALYGIKAVAINGSLTYERRARVVESFKEDAKIQVLIFSKVGSVGLNLTVADVLIFLVNHSLQFLSTKPLLT
jgi:SNF2 family DNA or RNA helicase